MPKYYGIATLFTLTETGRLIVSETFTDAIQKKIAEKTGFPLFDRDSEGKVKISDEFAEAIRKQVKGAEIGHKICMP